MWRGRIGSFAALVAIVLLAAACEERAPQAPTPTASATPAQPTILPTAIPTAIPTGTPSVAPSLPAAPVPATPSPAPTAVQQAPAPTPAAPVATPTAGAPSASPTATAPPAATATPTATPTPPPDPGSPAPEPVAHVTVSTGVPVRLAQGVVADLPGGRTLALIEVTGDSRCPPEVQCVWAGEANLLFEWAAPGETHRVPVVIAPGRGSSELPGGFVLRVLALNPATSTGDPIPAADYVATVVVETAGLPTSGAFGSVTVGPSCPVQREGVPCPDRPLAATLLFRNQSGVEVGRALSDATGFYAVALPAGRIHVVPFTPGGATLPRGIPRDIDVPEGDWIVADVIYDSGIR